MQVIGVRDIKESGVFESAIRKNIPRKIRSKRK